MKMRVVYLSILIALMLQIAQISAKGDNKADKLNPNVNGLGHVTRKTNLLSKFPMTVKSCDEVAIFKANYITDLNDYKQRAEAWFSISAYTVNMYKDKDANQLVHSVDIGNFKSHPHHLKGAKGCIDIDGGSSTDITICVADKGTADNLLEAIKAFYNCRRGDNLQPIPKSLIKKLIKQCSERKVNVPKNNLKVRPNNKWDADRERYHHPAGIHVPGTR
jgi:hypothetical protein